MDVLPTSTRMTGMYYALMLFMQQYGLWILQRLCDFLFR